MNKSDKYSEIKNKFFTLNYVSINQLKINKILEIVH